MEHMVQFLSVYSKNPKFYEKIFQQKSHSSKQVHKNICWYFTKGPIEATLVTLLPTLQMFLSVEKKFWKTLFKIIYQNFRSVLDKYLWRRSVLAKALPFWSTAILLMILKFMILWNIIEACLEPSQTSKIKRFLEIDGFFISNTFISNIKLKLVNQANAKQHSEAELLLFENYSHGGTALSYKNIRTISTK